MLHVLVAEARLLLDRLEVNRLIKMEEHMTLVAKAMLICICHFQEHQVLSRLIAVRFDDLVLLHGIDLGVGLGQELIIVFALLVGQGLVVVEDELVAVSLYVAADLVDWAKDAARSGGLSGRGGLCVDLCFRLFAFGSVRCFL